MNLSVIFLLACGPKEPTKTIPEAVTPPPEEVAPPPEPTAPEPPPEPEIESNADFNATFKLADGSSKSGHVIRLEKNKKYNGMGEWTDKKSRLSIEISKGSEIKEVDYSEIKKITIVPTSTKKNDSDCNFESDYEPRLYWCKQATKSKAYLKDGSVWSIDDKYKWQFYFDDDSTQSFWLNTYRVLEQEEEAVGMNDSDINNDLIGKLKEQLAVELTSTMVVQINFE